MTPMSRNVKFPDQRDPNPRELTGYYSVHEGAHLLGLEHNPGCGAMGINRKWPFGRSGRTHSQGYGLMTEDLYLSKYNYDIMSYCVPDWVSAWTYMFAYRSISQRPKYRLSFPPTMILRGFVRPNGEAIWSAAPGEPLEHLDADGTRIQLTLKDGRVLERLGVVEDLRDSTSYVVSAELGVATAQIARLRV